MGPFFFFYYKHIVVQLVKEKLRWIFSVFLAKNDIKNVADSFGTNGEVL